MANGSSGITRRGFIKGAAAAGAALGSVHILKGAAAGKETAFKVGLIGCGGRGSGAMGQHVAAYKTLNKALGWDLKCVPWAFADWHKGKAEGRGKQYNVPAERCFGGADAYRKVIDSGVDVVLMATPPVFRPVHFEACIEAGKHVFMEKPVAVDGPGARRVIAAGEKAREKGLTVVAGTQRRHSRSRIEHVHAIREGARGRVVGGRVSWCMGKIFSNKPINPKNADDLCSGGKWQLWIELSGDHICEQHIHNIDIANWYIGSPPASAVGFGHRHRRIAGNMYDFFSIDFDYPGHIHIHSTCRQIGGCFNWVGEHFTYEKLHGEKKQVASPIPDDLPSEGGTQHQEHINMLYYLVKGKPLMQARDVAESTAAAIMGRDSAYTGQRVTWKEMMVEPRKNLKEGDIDFFNRHVTPKAEDYEKGEIPAEMMPADGDIPVPGVPT